METLQELEIKEKFRGNLMNYLKYLEMEKLYSGKESTAGVYKATRKQLDKFLKEKKLDIKKMNARLAHDFVSYMQSSKLKRNSICNYASTFRSAYNSAVSENLIKPIDNLFFKISLRPTPTEKRALGVDMIKKMMNFDLKGKKRLEFARDLFFFCFMACGMAFVDLAHLTWDNIENGVIIYRRIKTKTEIRITITPGMQYLIDKYACPGSKLLFPILKSIDASYESYKVALRTYNRRLQKIGSLIDCPIKLTSYVARHSWAMCAKELNLPISLIGQALGHTTEQATKYYLSDLDQKTLHQANMKIIEFAEKWLLNRKEKK